MLNGIGVGIGFGGKVRKILIKDSFNRADSATTLGNTETGQTWVAQSAAWGTSGNAAYLTAGSSRTVISTAISNNYAVQITLKTVTSLDNLQRVIFRYVDTSNELYFGKATAAQYQLVKRVAGSATTLATIPQAPANGDVLRVEVRGSNIIAKINGVTVATVNDAANQSGTGFGLFSADNVGRFDDFVVEGI